MKVVQRLLLNWIYMLCFLGGFINTISIIKYSYTISHFTGSISKAAIYLTRINYIEIFKIFLIILSFIIGSTVAGFLINGREFNLKKRYGISMFLLGVGVLLIYFLAGDSLILFYYLPFILGVQNGLFISYNGVVIRTTHITGSITDIGVYLGHYLKGKKEDKWKGFFCFYMVLIFFIGGVLGIKFYFLLNNKVFILIGFFYIIISGVYFYLRKRYLFFSEFND